MLPARKTMVVGDQILDIVVEKCIFTKRKV